MTEMQKSQSEPSIRSTPELPREGGEIVLLDGVLGSDDDGGGAVADPAGAAGRHHAALLEDGGQLGQALQRRLH